MRERERREGEIEIERDREREKGGDFGRPGEMDGNHPASRESGSEERRDMMVREDWRIFAL